MGIKTHFKVESYDYIKYSGKLNLDPSKFDKKKERYWFHTLAKKHPDKEDFKLFIVANQILNPKGWVNELLSQDAEYNYENYKKKIQSLEYLFKEDMAKIAHHGFVNLLTVKDGEWPILLREYKSKNIMLETLVIVNKIADFIPYWDKNIAETIIWPGIRALLVKYNNFLEMDVAQYKRTMKAALKNVT